MSTSINPAKGSARLFIALWPSEPVRSALSRHQQGWRWPRSASLVRGDKLHLTLHFLGQVPRERLAELARELAVPIEPFELRLNRDELWPGGIAVLSPNAVPEALRTLHSGLHEALARLRFTSAREELRPHVTLARRAARAVWPEPGPDISWPVRGYALVESEPAGYRVLQSYCG